MTSHAASGDATENRVVRVTDQLRSMILDGTFQGGEHIREIDLANRLDVSRTPIRIALASLEREGLVVYAPNRGATVRTFKLEDIRDAYDVRAVLEGFAARRISEIGLSTISAEAMLNSVEALERLLAAGRGALNDEQRIAWRLLNRTFHDTIFREVGNDMLERLTRQTRQIPLVQHALVQADDRRRLLAYVAQHREILAAIRRREGTRADHLMQQHVLSGYEAIKASMGRAGRAKKP